MTAPYTPQELADRRAALDADLSLIATGWTPDAVDLIDAPVLDDYTMSEVEGGIVLRGFVNSHPRFGESYVTTARVVAGGSYWIRTLGRFFHLGQPAFGHPVFSMPVDDEAAQGFGR